jgi:hypothetical protein
LSGEASLKELFESSFPPREELSADWQDVLGRAHVSLEPKAKTSWSRALPALVTLVGIAAIVLAVIALWPSGSSEGVLQRALAALGDGPIVHVVYQDELAATLVDLRTGHGTPLPARHEEWYEPGAGLVGVATFGGHVSPAPTTRPRESTAAIVAAFRRSLQDGTAAVSIEQSFEGRQVYWVFLRTHAGGTGAYTHEVAIDAATALPVFVRRAGAGTGEEILSLQTLPAGSIDFASRRKAGRQLQVSAGTTSDLTAAAGSGLPAKALGAAPVWLGPRYEGSPLAYLHAQSFSFGRAGRSPVRVKGLELCYGGDRASCAGEPGHVLLQEATRPNPRYSGSLFASPVTIPEGSVLIGLGGTDGYLAVKGVLIHISASGEAAVIAVAKALRPLP